MESKIQIFPFLHPHRFRPHLLIVSTRCHPLFQDFYIVESLQIGHEGLARVSEGDTPECEETLFENSIAHRLHRELQHNRVDIGGWIERVSSDRTYDLDPFTCEFHSKREIGVMWFFISSCEDFFSDFFLHHDRHLLRRREPPFQRRCRRRRRRI